MRSAIVFALLGMATVFAPVWLSEGGLRRYVMPMYPLLAVVCGAVAQQALAAPIDRFLRQFWRYYLRVMAVVLAGFVVPFLAATVMRTFSNAHWTLTLGQPWPLMIALAAGTAGGVVFLVRQTAPNRTEHGLLATATIAALLAACYNGPLLNAGIEKLVNLEPQILALRRSLPANARLVSFGPVFHRFLYWYGGSIPIMDLPQTVYDVPDDLEYFAMDVRWDQTPDLPFAWQRLAQFDMNPRCSAHPVHLVVVGRRIPTSGDPADLPADTRRQTSPAAMQ